MDRRTALERLDAVRHGSEDLSEPDMAEVRDALVRDDGLRAEFDRRRGWDIGIATAIRDVPVPAGLEGRLLARLSSAESVVSPPRAPSGRRRMFASLAALTACFAAVCGYWMATESHTPVTTAEARDAALGLLSGRTAEVAFVGEFTPRLPGPAWASRLRVMTQAPGSGLLGENGEHRAAAWRIQSRGQVTWHAVLVAIPLDEVASPPQANSIADRDYLPGGKASGIQSVRWTEGGFVYVCVIDNLKLDALIGELENARFA